MGMSRAVILVSLLVVTCDSLNIVETAQATTDFSVLVEAIIKAKLDTTLSGTGPFTVFAPTNAAFTAALTALSITKAEMLAKSDLADILKYHVISGKIMAADLKTHQTPDTLNNGLKVMVHKTDTAVTFGGAKVSKADVVCDNGVIHFIDKVVLPPSLNVVETAQATADFSVLVEAIIKAKLDTTLSGTGPFTVFAPTNAAFTAALTDMKITKAELLARSDLADILKYHVISGQILAADLKATQSPATVQGQKVVVTKDASGSTFGGAKVTAADLPCKNGVIHTIDKVVLPPAPTTPATAPTTPATGAAATSLTSPAASQGVAASVAVSVAMMVLA